MFKRSLSYLILIAFGFILTPKVVWHECEDHFKRDNTSLKSEFKFEKNDCSICDFQLFQIDVPPTLNFVFEKINVQLNYNLLTNLVSQKNLDTQHRGPPSLI